MGSVKNKNRSYIVLIGLITLLILGVGTVWAVSYMNTGSVNNLFTGAKASIEVKETFNGTTKSNVYVLNNGNTSIPKGASLYVRVKLLAYWYDADSDHITSKDSWTPSFTPGSDWVFKDGFYYYKKPVAAGQYTSNLISSITLSKDSDGNRQVLEIVADAVQAKPASAVENAWGINVEGENLSFE